MAIEVTQHAVEWESRRADNLTTLPLEFGPHTGAIHLAIDEAVTLIGGGTGSYAILRGLRRHIGNGTLTSVHTIADNGGSSRKLMDEYGKPLPVGDLRQGLVAQSRNRRLWRDLFSYRFQPTDVGGGLAGHSLGNLILHALEDLNGGDVLEALSDAEQILNTVGHVLPVATERTTLCAELIDGQIIRGEDCIGEPETPDRPAIRKVYLDPQPHVTVRARKAIERSARIILGPGDVYTSIVPNLLVRGVPEAIADADAEVIYIVNLMTRPGETDGYRASDFVTAIGCYLRRLPDTVVVHTTGHDPDRIARYAGAHAVAVEADLDRLTAMVPRVVTGNFATEEQFLRHDAEKVVAALWPVEV